MESNRKKPIPSLEQIFREAPELEKFRQKFDIQDALYRFNEVFPNFAGKVTAVKIERKVLYLSTEISSLASEIKHNEVEILKVLNEKFPYPQIQAIRFTATASKS